MPNICILIVHGKEFPNTHITKTWNGHKSYINISLCHIIQSMSACHIYERYRIKKNMNKIIKHKKP